jgi:DNA-binding NtrC family response regulator
MSMSSKTLSSSDRAFFERVSVAAYANPFSIARERIDRELAGGVAPAHETLERAASRIEKALERVGKNGVPDVRAYEGADRVLLEHVLLFHVFHRHVADFDRAIERERASLGVPERMPFAGRFIRALVSAGVAPEQAHRVFELSWQMRRAFSAIALRLVGESPAMRAVREALWNAVFTHDIRRYEKHLFRRMEDFSTLVLGETGTGKEAAAAAIGLSGYIPFDAKTERFAESFTKSFLPLNLVSFAEGLVESELFGHRKGAFTGAVGAHEGAFARSGPHGTVFLDEVADIPSSLQVKLLRVLQERTYHPVGGHEALRFEGRIVAATHRDIGALRASGALRDDFYYRLSSYVIEMPTLRARIAETPSELRALSSSLVARIVGHDDAALADEIVAALARDVGEGYAWPGNVRELEHAIRRVLLTGHATRDTRRDARATVHDGFIAAVEDGALDAQALLAGYCKALYTKLGTYEAVGRVTGLDRRTVRKHVGDRG